MKSLYFYTRFNDHTAAKTVKATKLIQNTSSISTDCDEILHCCFLVNNICAEATDRFFQVFFLDFESEKYGLMRLMLVFLA